MPRPVRQPIPGDPRDPQGLTALLRRYLIWMETHHFAAGTVRVRRLQLSRFILWCHERSVTRAKDVTPEMIARFQRHLFYYRQHSGEPLSISSQSHWLTSLRGWFSWMKQQQVIEHHPTADMRLPRQEKRLPRHALSEQEVEAVMAQPDITTPVGLRGPGAVGDALFDRDAADRGPASAPLGLGPPPRCGPDPSGQGSQGSLRTDRHTAPWRGSTSTCGKRGRCWCRTPPRRCCSSPLGADPLHPNNVSSLVRRYLRRAGIHKPGACHLFRHAAASLMLDRGADIRHLQEILGHASLSTTQIYTHVSIGKLCEVHARTHPGATGQSPPGPSGPCAAAGTDGWWRPGRSRGSCSGECGPGGERPGTSARRPQFRFASSAPTGYNERRIFDM